MGEKLRSLKTSDPEFWAELCQDATASDLPDEGLSVPEDEQDLYDEDLPGDDSCTTIHEVVVDILEGDGKEGGLVPSNLAEDGGAEPVDINSGPVNNENLLTDDIPSTSEQKADAEPGIAGGKRKRTANRWYSVKNFIRHNDDEGSDIEL